jgi:hypothetical protein
LQREYVLTKKRKRKKHIFFVKGTTYTARTFSFIATNLGAQAAQIQIDNRQQHM